jgi:hypothetical protein
LHGQWRERHPPVSPVTHFLGSWLNRYRRDQKFARSQTGDVGGRASGCGRPRPGRGCSPVGGHRRGKHVSPLPALSSLPAPRLARGCNRDGAFDLLRPTTIARGIVMPFHISPAPFMRFDRLARPHSGRLVADCPLRTIFRSSADLLERPVVFGWLAEPDNHGDSCSNGTFHGVGSRLLMCGGLQWEG